MDRIRQRVEDDFTGIARQAHWHGRIPETTKPATVVYRFIDNHLQSIDLNGVRTFKTNREAFASHRKLVEWIEERAGPKQLGGRGTQAETYSWGLPSVTIHTTCYRRVHAWFDIPNPKDRFGPRLRDMRDRTKNLG